MKAASIDFRHARALKAGVEDDLVGRTRSGLGV
jgi:hypothetical protein